jgi:nitronate monooxygenase
MTPWYRSRVATMLGIDYPIIQGPFGGGLSSTTLVAEVSNLGGLGSFGAQGLAPEQIREIVADIRQRTARPFALNLWVSTEDAGTSEVTAEAVEAALALLRPFYAELGVEPPHYAPRSRVRFEDQVEALFALRVPAFSFVFGVPDPTVLKAARARNIVTIGTATTADEAKALEAADVDLVVASGSEAGGHRPSFLRPAEASLTGTFALVPQVVDRVRIPVIAAGGVADGRTVAAALTLGAQGVQVGTAFLACEESNAVSGHRAALFAPGREQTLLTRGFSGRLARGLRNRLAEQLAQSSRSLPYPLPSELLAPLRTAALARDRVDLVSLWAGQATPLVRHRRARDLFAALVEETTVSLPRDVSTP